MVLYSHPTIVLLSKTILFLFSNAGIAVVYGPNGTGKN